MENSNYYVTTKVSWYDNGIKYEYNLITHELTRVADNENSIACTYSSGKYIGEIFDNMNYPENIDHEVIEDIIKHYGLKRENQIDKNNVQISFSLFDKNCNKIKYIKCIDRKEKIIINMIEHFYNESKYYRSLKGFPNVYVEIDHLDFIKAIEELTTQEYKKYGKY